MSRTLRLVVLGAAAGLIAAWAMEESQKALTQAAKAAGVAAPSGEGSTVKAADRVAQGLTGNPIAPPRRAQAGRTVHYFTGAVLGALYTVLADRLSFITSGFGGLYGMAISGVLDEMVVPALELSPPAEAVPLALHAEGVAAHLVYGAALEASRRVLTLVL